MSKEWDAPWKTMLLKQANVKGVLEYQNTLLFQKWLVLWLQEVHRVLKPGGVVKAFGGTRTFHRLAVAMKQAGFEDIHIEAWCYGSGFPKSMNIGKALDKMVGAEREVVGAVRTNVGMQGGKFSAGSRTEEVKVTAPSSDAAKTWDGWGTALKPAWEPVLVGSKGRKEEHAD